MPKQGNPKPWIAKAEGDYVAALILIRKRKTPLSDAVCFHAQQCIEKYLKAFLVWHRVYFPKTHDLSELLDLAVPHDSTLELLRPFVRDLTRYAVAFRYPDEHATREEARQVVKRMRFVRERLRQALGLK